MKLGPGVLGTLGHRACPINRKTQEEDATEMLEKMNLKYPKWEYLQSKKGEDEIWLKDDIFDFECILANSLIELLYAINSKKHLDYKTYNFS